MNDTPKARAMGPGDVYEMNYPLVNTSFRLETKDGKNLPETVLKITRVDNGTFVIRVNPAVYLHTDWSEMF